MAKPCTCSEIMGAAIFVFSGGLVDTTDLTDRMKKRRKELGITQVEIARALAVTPQHISAIEQGKRVPSLRFIVGLAEQLGIITDYLLAGREHLAPDTVSVIRADQELPAELREALVTIIKTCYKK